MTDKPGDGGPTDSMTEGMEDLAEGAGDLATGGLAGLAMTGFHAGEAAAAAASGDWDDAADQATRASESATSSLFEGVPGMAEGAWDIGNAAFGGGEATTAHGLIDGGMHAIGDWLGDEAYKLVNGDDSGTTGTSPDPGSSADTGSSAGGDPGPAGGTDPGDAGAYDPGAYGDTGG